ncbi:helix-turn-helix transcriptional regulator [Agrococcus sp. Ld7]|uniref:helix-turn-helix transcriptional regulator n=1 Tax=Agrococcus sp. Ld7 TaxID=649148 RepID=UPI0038688A97
MTTLHATTSPAPTAYGSGMTLTAPPPTLDLYAASSGLLLTETQLAAALGVAAKTLRNWRALRTGPVWRNLGGALVRYRAGDVVAWLDSHNG